MLLSSSKLFPFSKEVHLNSGVRMLLELRCCSHQVCYLYYLGEINSGIHMNRFTFKSLHFCFGMWLWFRIWTKIFGGSMDLAKKRHGSEDMHTPIHPSRWLTKVRCELILTPIGNYSKLQPTIKLISVSTLLLSLVIYCWFFSKFLLILPPWPSWSGFFVN